MIDTQAIYWCTKAAERGDADAQFALALIYDRAIKIVPDNAKTVSGSKTDMT